MKALLEEANPEVAAEAEAARQAAEAEAVRLAAEAERRRAAEQAEAEERAAAKVRREAYLRQKAEEQRRAAERAEALRVAAERAAAAAAEKEALRTRPTELNAKVAAVQPWQVQFVLEREARMLAVEKENLARNQLLASIRSSVARIQDARNREHLAAQRVMWAQQNMSLDAMQRWSMDLARAAIHAETGANAMERKSKSSA